MKKFILPLTAVLLIIGLAACQSNKPTEASIAKSYKQNSDLYKQAIEIYNYIEKASKNSEKLTPKQVAKIDLFEQNFSKVQMLQLKLMGIDPKDEKTRKKIYKKLKKNIGDEYFPPPKIFDIMQSITLVATDYSLVKGEFMDDPSSSDWETFIKDNKKLNKLMNEMDIK